MQWTTFADDLAAMPFDLGAPHNMQQPVCTILPRTFYERDTEQVARDLLGKILVRQIGTQLLTGMITETEAYLGSNDSASHAYRNRTPRNEVMFGLPGFAYIYFVYGLHHMLNVVTDKEGVAGAVLIRQVQPLSGIEVMVKNRRGNKKDIANGPARLCQAFAISLDLNKNDLTCGNELWIEDSPLPIAKEIIARPRIGINYAQPEDQAAPLRFLLRK